MNINTSVRHFGLLGLMLLIFSTIPFIGQESATGDPIELDPCFIENNSFEKGEELTYKLYYHLTPIWLPAGELVMKVEDAGDEYHVTASGRTYKSYEWFYKVRDYYSTHIDKETLLPRLSLRDIQEGKYTLYDRIEFDQDRKIATSLRGDSREEAREKTYDLGECMHDLLSILYYARNLDYDSMEKGSLIPVKIFIDKEIWPLTVSYDGKEEKRIKGMGKVNTITFSPEVIEGYVFTETDKLRVWATDDANRIPLMIESPVSVGSIRAVLKDYKGIRPAEDRVLK